MERHDDPLRVPTARCRPTERARHRAGPREQGGGEEAAQHGRRCAGRGVREGRASVRRTDRRGGAGGGIMSDPIPADAVFATLTAESPLDDLCVAAHLAGSRAAREDMLPQNAGAALASDEATLTYLRAT